MLDGIYNPFDTAGQHAPTHTGPCQAKPKAMGGRRRGESWYIRLHGCEVHVGAVLERLRNLAELDAAVAECRVSACSGGAGRGVRRNGAGKERGQEDCELHSG